MALALPSPGRAQTCPPTGGDIVYHACFDDETVNLPPTGWTVSPPAANVLVRLDGTNQVLSDGTGGGAPVTSGDPAWANVSVSQRFRRVSGVINHAGLIARYVDDDNMVYGGIVTATTAEIWNRIGGVWTQLGVTWTIPDVSSGWHTQELKVAGGGVSLSIDGTFVGSAALMPAAPAAGTTGFWSQYGVTNEGYRDDHVVQALFPLSKPITIDRTMIPGGCGTTLPDYPMLFNSTDPDLAHTTSGGNVTDLQGDDIVFKALDDATCGGAGLAPCALDHEVERYVSTTGELVAWVRIPSVNTAAAASDTVIYVYYGSPSVTSPTENPTGVWDSAYVGVWHLKGDPSDPAPQIRDSTSQGNHGTSGGGMTSTDQVGGPIDGGLDFDSNDYISMGDQPEFALPVYTWSAWVRGNAAPTSPPAAGNEQPIFNADRQFNFSWSHNSAAFQQAAAHYDGLSWQSAQIATALSGSTWYHLAATYDGSDLRMYLNGGLEDTQPLGPPDVIGGPLAIGNDPAAPNWAGRMDEFRVSDDARSSCWIGASYNNQVWPDKAVTPTPDPSPNPDDGFYGIGPEAATAVELVSFEAQPQDGAVDLAWETGTELDNLGFHLYRAVSESGPFERITTSLIPGLGSSPEGARYGYRDVGLVNGVTYFYELEDVETTGVTERHGPVSATPQAGVPIDPPADPGDPEPEPEPGDPAETPPSWIAYGDPEATSLSVVERGRRHLVLELRTGGFYARPDAEGGVWLQVPGFTEADTPGAPALPVSRPWLEAVAGRKVRLVSVRGRDVVAFSSLRPAVTGEPELWAEADGSLRAGQRRTRPGRAFRGPGVYPEVAARLLGVAFQGQVKKAQLELAPLRWDREGSQLLLARRLLVRVSFAGRAKDELALGGSRGRKKRAPRGRPSDGVIARLATRDPGLYAVAFEDVFGSRRRGVRLSKLRLSRQGETVGFHVEPPARRFRPGSRLYFVSGGADLNPYGPEAVYELSMEDGGVAMAVTNGTPQGGTIPHYWARGQWEENRLYRASLLTSPDLWLWDYVSSGSAKSYPFAVNGLAPTGEPSLLQVWLQGASDYAASPDHHVRVSVNGYVVGEASWDGKHPQRIEAEVGPGVLLEGENTLQLENVPDTGAEHSLVILDRYALTHPRRLEATGGALEGRFRLGGTAEVRGAGPSSFVVDTTEEPARWLTGVVSTPEGVSFRAEAGRDYLAISAASVRRPEVRPASDDTLRAASNRADYVVLGPRAFLEEAEPLLELRRRQGLEALGVAIEEVYDAFGQGEARPEAVRAFLGHAFHQWELAPRYVLLLGDASYDFKDHLGTGIENPVPPYMVQDAYMWTVSDPTYAAVNGEDPLPDLAIGRLPAQSLEQARALVAKVLAWESAGFDLSGRAVLVADNSDSAGDFEGDAERVAALFLSDREVERVYLSRLGGATTAAIHQAFDEGASLMSYLGHGAIGLWASERVLSTADVATLAPQPQQPFLLTMNCLNGYFHKPSLRNSLAEELLKAEGKGAIGTFSPSSMGEHWAARLYHEAMVAELASGRHERLGDALLAAQNAYAHTGARPDLLSVYQLLADPALRLR